MKGDTLVNERTSYWNSFCLPLPENASFRHRIAATWLIRNNFAVARRLSDSPDMQLLWRFDTRVGRERNHDRALSRVLPLLLPLRVDDDLYPFQRSGVAWLLLHRRAILADDMGLGKTIQVIAALRRLYRHGRISSCLVIVPGTLLANWMSECDKWAPELVSQRLEFVNRTFTPAKWRSAVARAHILLATYDDLRGLWDDIAEQPPDIIVADEAHRLRKADSLAHQAMRRIESPWLWGLTGTPVERDAEDLACLLSLLYPARFAIDDHRLGIATLRPRARPHLLRRTKADVLPELPPVEERLEKIPLHPKQRETYNAETTNFASSTRSGYLPLFTRLRSICDLDPATGASSKLDRTVDLVSAASAQDEKTVVFSYTIDPLRALLSLLRAKRGNRPELLVGEMSLAERKRAVDRFKTDPHCQALLASMRVGSEGLTLTEANNVIFVNRWWNPSTNSQAVDRVVRIGQRKPVTVHYLTCLDTVEDRLQPMLTRKKMTFDQLIDALRHQPELAHELLK